MNVPFSMRRVAWLPALLLAVACQRGPSPEAQARIEELTVANRERDQLLQEMAENSRFLSEISVEIAKVQVPKRALRVSSESPLRASRDTMMQKIRYVAARVVETEARLKETRRRVEQLTGVSDSLRRTLAETVANYDEIVTAHRATIEFLSGQVQGLEAENHALSDTLTRVAARANTAYYVVGTEEELVRRGLLVKEGGSRFLFVLWKQGTTLQPSRDLTPDAFTMIDRRRVGEIPLPDRTAEYRIVSRQDLDYLATRPTDDGALRGAATLRIADSERFWAPSRYLIIVRKGGRGTAAAS